MPFFATCNVTHAEDLIKIYYILYVVSESMQLSISEPQTRKHARRNVTPPLVRLVGLPFPLLLALTEGRREAASLEAVGRSVAPPIESMPPKPNPHTG